MKNIDEKIKKIVALIEGAATEGEARAASLALQRLLVANNLKLEDINLDDSPAEVGEEVCDLGRRIPEWKKTLALVVAANYRCRAYTSYNNNGRTVVFVGEGEDSVVASYCFRASANAAENCFRTYCARMKAMGYGNVSRRKGGRALRGRGCLASSPASSEPMRSRSAMTSPWRLRSSSPNPSTDTWMGSA